MTRADDLAARIAANKRAAAAARRGCAVPGCEKPHNSHGYCSMHNQRMARRGTTDDPPPPHKATSRRSPHNLIRADQLDHRHHGHHIKVDGLEGEFVGVVPMPGGQRVVIALIVGGARAWKDVAVGEFVEVWRAAT